MKSKMKRQRQTELPRFAVGALAIAGASAASGATVQITFANNLVSSSTGLTLFDADLTGDDAGDGLRGVFRDYAGAGMRALVETAVGYFKVGEASWRAGGGPPGLPPSPPIAKRGLGSVNDFGNGVSRGLVRFTFSDPSMNGGSSTAGWLDVSAAASLESGGSASVQIHRLIFDDASTTAPTGLTSASTGIQEWSAVPEPSSLGLLALGAGGLLARRRRAA